MSNINHHKNEYSAVNGNILEGKYIGKTKNDTKMWEMVETEGKVSGRTAFDAMRLGDKMGKEVVDEYILYLAEGITNMINIFQPEVFVIGGGVSKAGEILTEGLKKHYNQNLLSALYDKEFRLATLGNDAGIYGSAKIILDQVTAK